MSEVQVVNVGARFGIGTDAKVPGPICGPCIQGPDVDRLAEELYKEAFSLAAARVIAVVPDLPSHGHYWQTMPEMELPYSTRPENRKAETAYMYRGAIASMDVEKAVCIREIVGSEFCVAARDGQRVYEVIKNELVSGASVSLSFQGVRNITAVFLHLAIGQMYNGDFLEEDLKRK